MCLGLLDFQNDCTLRGGFIEFMKWHTADVLEYGLLKENAKVNRGKMTEAEAVFWNIAKGSGLGQKCRRQYIIGDYIVDFFFRESLLNVELDGGYHRSDPQSPSKVAISSFIDKKSTGDLLSDFSNTLREGWRGTEQIEYDRIRQDWLEHMGYKVLRFTNEEVLFDTERVIDIIKNNF